MERVARRQGQDMGQVDKGLRFQVFDADKALHAELKSLSAVGMDIVVREAASLVGRGMSFADRDVVVVNVETAAGLALVAQICAREDAPAVIAIGGKGFGRKPLEHVLVLAEVRGAVATLPKPFDAAELAMAAIQVRRRPGAQQPRATTAELISAV